MSFLLGFLTRGHGSPRRAPKSEVQAIAGAMTAAAMLLSLSAAHAAKPVACPDGVNPKASTPLTEKTSSASCSPKSSHGFPIPDPACTPGAFNPTVTLAVLQGGKFKTGCDRDKASSKNQKNTTYAEYGLDKPANNTGKSQICELDHLVSLELGGADTIDNIWPQCGPDDTVLAKRFFKMKDSVENYLAQQVRDGAMDISEAQRGIAQDWTQYLDAATGFWKDHAARGFGRDQ